VENQCTRPPLTLENSAASDSRGRVVESEGPTKESEMPVLQDVPDTSEVLSDSLALRTAWTDYETFSQTRLPLEMSDELLGDFVSISEEEYPQWILLDSVTDGTREHASLLQQLVSRPAPSVFLIGDEFLSWLAMSTKQDMERMENDKPNIWKVNTDFDEAWYEEDEWSMMPHACDVEKHMMENTAGKLA
jgi:hypothetical protein